MRAIDKLSSSSSLRVGLSFAFLMLLAAFFVGYGLLTGNEPSIEDGAAEDRPSVLQDALGWALILFLVLSAIASLWIGHYVFSRINRIADTAGDIMTSGDLGARLPVDSSWDDLSRLSVVLNRMLGEIEQLMGSVQSVSDNIAHDLRTPLTRLKTQIDHIDDPALRARLKGDVDGIIGMFDALLRIADIEADKQRRSFSPIRLDQILSDVVDLYRPLADAKSIEIAASLTRTDLIGDRDLMFQALSNVLDNAIKFTPDNGRIAVSARAEEGIAMVEIADSGIGIPDSHKEGVTRRFYRVDDSRSKPGHGLGLAMVAAIVKRHDGVLSLHDARDHGERTGLRCRLRFAAPDKVGGPGDGTVRTAPSSP